EKNRVIGQVIQRIVPCAEPIQSFRPRRTRRTSRASRTLWPLTTGYTLRPLRTNGADYAGRPGGALRTSRSLSAGRTRRALLSQRCLFSHFNRRGDRLRSPTRRASDLEKNRVIGQVIQRIVPCAEPIQPFLPRWTRRTSRAS